MPSRLSSLLVRDGLVGVKRMEKAFQRQVIYGGSLDTILLEMNLIPEDRLTQYLALASGLPPAARDEGKDVDPAVTATISRELAEQHRAVPFAVAGEAVRVLVCSPLEITELEDLADQLDRPLQPLITPEYRWHLMFAASYRLDPPARFTTLARSLDAFVPSAPVGRAKTIIVDEPVTTELTERTAGLADATTKGPMTPLRPAASTPELPTEGPSVDAVPEYPFRDRRPTLIGVLPNRAATDTGLIQSDHPAPDHPAGGDRVPDEAVAPDVRTPDVRTPDVRTPDVRTMTPSSGVPRAVPESGPSRRPSGRSRPLGKRAATQPIVTEGRDSVIAIPQARELLATAEDRDTVFLTLLRAARSCTRFAALLTVQGGAASGRVALAEAGLDTAAVNTILIPLDGASAFRTVVGNHQPHIGPLISGDPNIDSMVLRMGGTMPPSALVLPVVLRDRVVALVVAHRVHSDLRLEDVTELLPLAIAASEAIGRLIVKHKSAGHRAPAELAVPIEADAIDTKKITRDDAPWRTPDRPPSVPAYDDLEVSITSDPPRPIDEVLDEIERAPEGASGEAIADAVERATESLGSLQRRFPGTLRIDRFAVPGRRLRAAQYGGLLELVIGLGSDSSELVIEKMGAAQRDVRFYATVCTAELRPSNAVHALAERLFDQDFGVRSTAIEALSGYPLHDLDPALMRARRGVHSRDSEVVAAATAAIVELGDTDAIADLIGVIERSDRAGDHARKALTALTSQDFGGSERKWRKWWDGARKRHRIEWLIDGLGHKDDAIRETAINDLRRLTGEYFGYHHDLPRRDREAAIAKWTTWWKDAGQRRFREPT